MKDQSIQSSGDIHLEECIIEYDYIYTHESEASDRSTPERTDIEVYRIYYKSESTSWKPIDITSFADDYCGNLYDEIVDKIKEEYED